MTAIDLAPSRFEIGTRHAFGLVDPVFQEACRRYIAMFVAYIMRLVQAPGQLQIAFPEFGQHVVEPDEIGIIIGHPLQLRDANGSSWFSDKEQHVSQQHRRGIADGVLAIIVFICMTNTRRLHAKRQHAQNREWNFRHAV